MLVSPTAKTAPKEVDRTDWTSDYAYVFVHGLIGWGDNTLMDSIVSYFGTFSGNLMQYLRSLGLDCHSATLSLENGAWDRACELYAQLTGTRTDYGKAHSEQCHHARYGRDFTGRPLIDAFDAEHKINLIGHSFGGTTIIEFLELMANGDAAEREATPQSELSPLFAGGKEDWIYSLTTLASPTNGTTLYEFSNPNTLSLDGHDRYPGQWIMKLVGSLTEKKTRPLTDNAAFDMQVDRAISITSSCETIDSVYYFSHSTMLSESDNEDHQVPNRRMVFIMKPLSKTIGMFEGVTANGVELNDDWKPNDGLVNTISERAPFNAPQKDIDFDNVEPGIWNAFPVRNADHMFYSGGFLRTTDVRTFYVDYIDWINSLPAPQP